MPFCQLKQSVARLFRKSLCNLIPRIERLLQGELRFDILLDLVKRETEFTRRTTWSPAPRVTNSICQRIRYDLRTSAVEPTERVVNTITYVANSICAASTDAPVESRGRSFELHITGPQTPNLDHADNPPCAELPHSGQ